jgi:hypothetical protein
LPNDIFTDKITPFCITSGIGCLLSYFIIDEEEDKIIASHSKFIKIAIFDVLIHICLVAALLKTSYTLVVMVNACSLLSVVIVAAYFSGLS